jgi:hypothetical protein
MRKRKKEEITNKNGRKRNYCKWEKYRQKRFVTLRSGEGGMVCLKLNHNTEYLCTGLADFSTRNRITHNKN